MPQILENMVGTYFQPINRYARKISCHTIEKHQERVIMYLLVWKHAFHTQTEKNGPVKTYQTLKRHMSISYYLYLMWTTEGLF